METSSYYQRYGRQLLLPQVDEAGQQALSEAAVAIIGLGGLGSIAASYLVGAGVGHIRIVDHDEVALGNLHRQTIFRESQIGMAKVDAALENFSALNDDVKITPYRQKLSETTCQSVIEGNDIVLDCTDNLSSRWAINHSCHQLQLPLLSAAAIGLEGQYLPVLPSHNSGCYQCLYDTAKVTDAGCLAQGILGPVVAMLGLMQALDALKYIVGIGSIRWGQLHRFNAMTNQWQYLAVPPNTQCLTCGDFQ